MPLESYWPEAGAVNACIKNEAETADVSVLLAVHQPSPVARRNAGSGELFPATEQEFLDAFLTDNVPGGALIMPITGPSGVGKSHIVRWLDAQLQRSDKSDQLHIIRIPKSASLRTVVQLILAPLANDPRYAKPSADLTRAVAEVNVKDAVITFRAHLENALTAMHDRMITEFRQHTDRPHLKELIGHARWLPRLFSDAALDRHFIDVVLSRVVSRALSGRSDGEAAEEAISQFTADDLVLPTGIDLSQAAKPVRDYYQTQIAVAPAERLDAVVDLLNSAVDPAIYNVFQLEQNTGGMTLPDIILAVREILLQDGKDLVLLVEDFQALAGIQEVLLKVCIQEGEYEGKKVRATMRTALALTDGYLTFRDTILTRAQREWVIGGRAQSDNEIKDGVVEMVGAYLNAARWGESELRSMFRQRAREQATTGWLPAWRDDDLGDEDVEAVAAFGSNSAGASLFPFNRTAIEVLAEQHLTKGGKLDFNPRKVINEILRHTLLMRRSFETRGFPPPDFQNFTVNSSLAVWIHQTRQPDQIKRRLSTLLAIWGGNPSDLSEIGHIPPAIFRVYDLPTPAELANVSYTPLPPRPIVPATGPGDPTKTTPRPEPIPPPPAAVDPEMAAWRAKLDAWAAGTQLGQKEANEIRTALCALAKDAMNWPSLRIREMPIRPQWIAIPNARGSDAHAGRIIHLCDDHRDENGLVRAGILASLRYSKEKSWMYPGADEDYVLSSALVDHLLAQLVPLLIEDAKAEAAALSRALITQSRIVGLSPPIRPAGAEAVLESLFAESPIKKVEPFEDGWDKLRESAYALIEGVSGRQFLQNQLLSRAATFQGAGRKASAVDVPRLLDALASETVSAAAVDRLPEEIKAFMRPLADGRLWSQLARVVAKLRDFKATVSGYIDEQFDKAAFVADIQEIVRLLNATGTFPSSIQLSNREFEEQLAEFQASPIVELVTKTETIVEEADREQVPKLLNALGSLPFAVIGRAEHFLKSTAALAAAAEASVSREETLRDQVDPSKLADDIVSLLRQISGPVEVAETA
jgi:hypothetical protein